jgi:type III pantothenate kinase
VLAVDVGNSETSVGVFAGGRLALHSRVGSSTRTPDEAFLLVRSLLEAGGFETAGYAAVLSSVVPPITPGFVAALRRLTGRAPLVVGERPVRGLRLRVPDPGSVGPDRIANALAVQARYGAPAIVVDLGTATTLDVVDRRGDYIGGAIAPGVWTSSEELFRRAARLTRVELALPRRAIGRTTEECLQSGIVFGYAGMVDALVRRVAGELGGRPRVVATGGLAPLLAPLCETVQGVDEWLTLQGLLEAHRRAAGRRR